MVNRVTLIGNLGKDPEVRHLENGTTVAQVTLATTENYRDKAGNWQSVTEWHRVVMWRNLGERAEKDLKKGMLIYVEGKLSTRKWTNKEGQDQYTTEVVASYYRILDRRENSTGNSYSTDNSGMADNNNGGSTVSEAENSGSMPETDDLPF